MRVSGNLVVIGAIEFAGRVDQKRQKLPPICFDTRGRFLRIFSLIGDRLLLKTKAQPVRIFQIVANK